MKLKLEKIKTFLTGKKNITLIYVIVIIGVTMLCIPSFEKGEKTEQSNKYVPEITEERLEKILSEIEGVGKCQVMITYKTSGEYITAKDITESAGDGRGSKDEKNVIIGSGSGEKPFVIKEKMPTVLGVLVVCDGGESEKVRKNVSAAVCALCDIGVNKVVVFKK